MAIAKITTLTPVHVGSGTTYNRNIDFVQEGGRIGIVDANKVAALIGSDKAAIDQWVSAIESGTPLIDFLRTGRGLRNVKLEDISERICLLQDTNHQAQNLKEQYRTSIQGVCIPGSSLKGAIKTAVWDNLANSLFLERLNSGDLKDRRGNWDDGNVDAKLFGKSANEQSTRFLKIGDIHFNNLRTEVHEMRVLNKHFEKWKFKEGSHLIESIPTEQNQEFEFKIDELLLKRNLEKDLESKIWIKRKIEYLQGGTKGIASLINDFTMALLNWEFDVLETEKLDKNQVGEELLDSYDRIYKIADKCNENEFVIRIGGHSGWIFTTGGWIRNESLNIGSEMKYLRKTIQRNREYDMALWPKTRKITPNGTIFGFVKIRVER
ncbi:MAG: type III-A CRISPR-associated RAMP protein Csm5 [Runella zeae]